MCCGKAVRLKGRLRAEPFGGLIFCMDPLRILMLNPTAYEMALGLRQGEASEAIAKRLARQYAVSPTSVADDVREFLTFLQSQSVLEWE